MDDSTVRRRRLWYILLALPFIGLLYPPLYATKSPEIWGIPFFYWYQFLWVFIASLLTGIVYFATRAGRDAAGTPRDRSVPPTASRSGAGGR